MSSNRLVWVEPGTMGCDPIGLDWTRDDGVYVRSYGYTVPLIVIGYACHGDYDNSSAVEVANERALWGMGDDVTRVLRHLDGYPGWQGVALTLPGPVQRDLRKRVEAGGELDANDAIAALREYLRSLDERGRQTREPGRYEVLDVLEALDGYPVIDDELLSEVEQEIAHESWVADGWGAWGDLKREVDDRTRDWETDDYDQINDAMLTADPEQALWWAQSGDRGGFSPCGYEWGEVETHDTAYFRTDDMATAVVECWQARRVLPWDAMNADQLRDQSALPLF